MNSIDYIRAKQDSGKRVGAAWTVQTRSVGGEGLAKVMAQQRDSGEKVKWYSSSRKKKRAAA